MLKRRSVPFFVTRPKVVHADPVRMPGVTNPVESTLGSADENFHSGSARRPDSLLYGSKIQ